MPLPSPHDASRDTLHALANQDSTAAAPSSSTSPRNLRITTGASPAAADAAPPSPVSSPVSMSSPSSRSASPTPRTPTHPQYRPNLYPDPPQLAPSQHQKTGSGGGAGSAGGPSFLFGGRAVSQSGSRSGQRRKGKGGTHSPRTPALHAGALAGLSDKELPAEETQQSDVEGEYSFSETPVSSLNSTTSTSSSLPSTSTAVGRCLRWLILALRSCVNSKTKRILTISSVVSLCFVIGTIIYVNLAISDLQSDYDWVVHTDQVKVTLDAIYISLLNCEASVRGYIITNNATFLASYNTNLPTIWPEFYNLTNLTTDNAVQQAYQAQLMPLLTTRLAFLNATVYDFNTSGFTAAQTDIVAGSQSVLNTIRAVLNAMTAEESVLLTQRENTFDHSIHTVTIVLYVVLVAVAVTILAGLLVGYDWDTRYLKRTNGKLEILLQKAEEGTKMKSLFLANMSHEIRTPMVRPTPHTTRQLLVPLSPYTVRSPASLLSCVYSLSYHRTECWRWVSCCPPLPFRPTRPTLWTPSSCPPRP